MLPAEMADGTRARVRQRAEENAGDGDPNAVPEVALPNGVDGDNPLVIPERGEGESREDYSLRVIQIVTQHQIQSFYQVVQSMKYISKEVKKKKDEWGETEEEEGESDNSNYQDTPERPKIRRIRKRIQAPSFKGTIGE